MKKITSLLKIFSALATIIFLSACGGAEEAHHDHHDHSAHAQAPQLTSAVAVLHSTEGNSAHGTVYFNLTDDGKVSIVAEISGLKPNSHHGFHIHEYGDCTAPDGTSAGGHYAPEGHPHGAPGKDKHHAGDLGNVQSDAEGNARMEMTVDFITINGMKNPILGRGVILHAGKDDLTSQPTGAAGARIACGVIGVANPETAP